MQAFEEELHNRGAQLESVKQTANDLIREANAADAAALRTQLNEVDGLWNRVNKLSDRKNNRLLDALREVKCLLYTGRGYDEPTVPDELGSHANERCH